MAICRCWNAQLSLSQRASAGLLGGLLCGGWQRDSRIPAIEASRARFESIRAILVGLRGWKKQGVALWVGVSGSVQPATNSSNRLVNAGKSLIHRRQFLIIIGYPSDVPARAHILHQCSGFDEVLILFEPSVNGWEFNLTSDSQRHNETRSLHSPVVDVLANSHTRYRAVCRYECSCASRR